MKKLIFAAAMAATVLLLPVSCNKNEEDLTISTDCEALVYPPAGGTYDIKLTTENSWKFLGCADWLSVNPESGTGDATVTVIVDEWPNEELEKMRNAGAYFTDGIDTALVVINQVSDDNYDYPAPVGDHAARGSGSYKYLNIDSPSPLVVSPGSPETVGVDSSAPWHIEGGADWITITPTSGGSGYSTFTVSVSEWENPGNNDVRQATIYVVNPSAKSSLVIEQAGN